MVVAADEPEDLGGLGGDGVHDGRGQLPDHQGGGGAVAVVELVAHLERLGDQVAQVERAGDAS